MILTGENCSTGRKKVTVLVIDGWMSMEQWWNGSDKGQLEVLEDKSAPLPFRL
jgi:hypothetical protein